MQSYRGKWRESEHVFRTSEQESRGCASEGFCDVCAGFKGEGYGQSEWKDQGGYDGDTRA